MKIDAKVVALAGPCENSWRGWLCSKSSGASMAVGFGAPGVEQTAGTSNPGGLSAIPFSVTSASRMSVRDTMGGSRVLATSTNTGWPQISAIDKLDMWGHPPQSRPSLQ